MDRGQKNFKYYDEQKVWPLLLIVLLGGAFWAFAGMDSGDTVNSNEDQYANQQKLLTGIGAILEQKHYNPKPIDDAFSKSVFTKYLDDLDPDKIFLKSDVSDLSKYGNKHRR